MKQKINAFVNLTEKDFGKEDDDEISSCFLRFNLKSGRSTIIELEETFENKKLIKKINKFIVKLLSNSNDSVSFQIKDYETKN